MTDIVQTEERCTHELRWSKDGKLQQRWKITEYGTEIKLSSIGLPLPTAVREEWRDVPTEVPPEAQLPPRFYLAKWRGLITRDVGVTVIEATSELEARRAWDSVVGQWRETVSFHYLLTGEESEYIFKGAEVLRRVPRVTPP